MADYSNIEGLSGEDEQIRLRRQMEALLGDQFNEEDSFREQAQDVLAENNIRNSATVAAQASDLMLVDYMRLFYLQQEFEGVPVDNIPGVIAYEMADLQSDLDLTQAPEAGATPDVYSGPTVNISEGPAAVTAAGIADSYVEKFGSELAEGPLDHTDTVITQADLRDAVEKYESIEITPDEIEAYQQRELQAMIDVRMDGIAEDDPEYDKHLERATDWAHDMGMPRESFVVASLRHERFLEEYPEMALSEEQAAAFAADGGPDADLAMRAGNILSYYTDTDTAAEMGMGDYATDLADIRNEIETNNQQVYEAEISGDIENLTDVGDSVANAAHLYGNMAVTGIDRDTLLAQQDEMAASLDSREFNDYINQAHSSNEALIADVEQMQLEHVTQNFPYLQEAAAAQGYEIESSQQFMDLLHDAEGGESFRSAMLEEPHGARFLGGMNEFSRLETVHMEAIRARGEIEMVAAQYEEIELEDITPDAPENAEDPAAATAEIDELGQNIDFANVANQMLVGADGDNNSPFGQLNRHVTGEQLDVDRFNNETAEMLPAEWTMHDDFNIQTPEGLTAALATYHTYHTGEIPDADTMAQIEDTVDTAFDDPEALQESDYLAEAANGEASVSLTQVFDQAHGPSSFLGISFGRTAAPAGFEQRLEELQAQHAANTAETPAANVNDPLQEHPQQGGFGLGS